MATDTLSIADRLERSGLPSGPARAVASELAEVHEARNREHDSLRRELVTREYLDLALAKLRAETDRDIARLELKIESQGNRILVWMAAIIGLAVTIVSGLGVLF